MKFDLGRSMIEMLGVLAIIGVLSIGGMYGYKQAMMRYRLNQTQYWLSRMRFAVIANCYDDNGTRCALGDTETGYYTRRDLLCAELGQDFCGDAFPYIKGISWLVYVGYQPHFTVLFRRFNKEYCEAFIERDWANLAFIRDYTKNFTEYVSATGKNLTQKQKDLLKARCPFSDLFILGIYRHD